MTKMLHILFVEDQEDDAELIRREIQRGGYQVSGKRVETRTEIDEALAGDNWDLIICDYSLPRFNALNALEALKASGLDLPFIVVSGTITEEGAVTALRSGAHDFIVKGNLARLLPAIQRELRDIVVRRERREAEEKYRILVEQLPMIVYINPVDEIGHTKYVSPQLQSILGYTPQEWLADPAFWQKALHPDDHDAVLKKIKEVSSTGKPFEMEYRMVASDGHIVWFHDQAVMIRDRNGKPLFWQGVMVDFSVQKRAEEALLASEERFRRYFELGLIGMAITSPAKGVIEINDKMSEILGYEKNELMQISWDKLTHPDDLAADEAQFNRVLAGEINGYSLDKRWIRKDGKIIYTTISVNSVRRGDGAVDYFVALVVDITDRKQAEEALERQDAELRQRNNELARLYRASETLLAGTQVSLPGLGAAIVQTVLSEFEHSNCSLFLVNRETRELDRLAAEGPYAEEVKSALLSLDGAGLVPKAIRTGEIINVSDVDADPNYVSNWKLARSELVVPLKVGNEVIGALDVQSSDPSAFDTNDERLMSIFAERAALGIERTRLHEQTLRQLERLGSLRTIDLAISSTFDLRLLLNIVLEQVLVQLNVDSADVLLFHPGTMRLEYISGRGFRTRAIESTSLRLGEGAAGESAVDKRIIHIADLANDREGFLRRDLIEKENFVSYFAVPLLAKGEVKGVLEIFHRTTIRANMEWLDFLDALGWQTAIAVDNAHLVERIQRSNTDLQLAYDATIEGWSHAMDLRDKETEGHTLRVTEMAMFLARVMGFRDDQLVHIRRGALLHDIGKLGVPDGILLKPDKLTEEEWESMRQHPQLAYEWMSPIKYLQPALEIPYCHHEKWDGTGYPRGLKGELIPLSARIFAVVDVWDALTNDRPYRLAWSTEKTLGYIRENSGKHFDPHVVEVFLQHFPKPQNSDGTP